MRHNKRFKPGRYTLPLWKNVVVRWLCSFRLSEKAHHRVAFSLWLIVVVMLTGGFAHLPASLRSNNQQPIWTEPAQPHEHSPPRTPRATQTAISQQRVQFDHLTVEDGLSHPVIYDILQDRQGFLWFATEDGLNRYDGYTFKVYKPIQDDPDSLQAATIMSLIEDHHGNLWVGTRGGGLSKFDPITETFTTYQHDPDNPNSISGNMILFEALYEDAQGYIWAGTPLDGLNRLDPATDTFTHYRHDPDNPNTIRPGVVTSLAPALREDGHEGLWIGTINGLSKFDPATETFTHYPHDPDDPHTLSSNDVNTLAVSPAGDVLWVGTKNGLNRMDVETGQVTRYLHNPNNPNSVIWHEITSLCLKDDGTLWISTPVGLDHFDPSSETFTHYQHNPADPTSLSNNIVHPILFDTTGALWVGTWGGGVNHFDPSHYKFKLYQHDPTNPQSLSYNNVLGLHASDEGIVWVGTWGDGLNRFDPQTETFTHYRHDPDDPHSLSNNDVQTIYEDSQGVLWVGTWGGGLNRFDQKTKRFTHYLHDPNDPHSLQHNSVRAIAEDAEGTLWIGTTYGGLNRFDRKTERFTSYLPDPTNPHSIATANIWDVFIDSNGIIWLGSGGGIERLDPQTEQFTQYHHDPDDPHSFRGKVAIQIHEDRQGIIWITSDAGLNRFDPQTEQFTHYTRQDGLPSDRVETILEDNEGMLWLGTSKGLSRFDPETETFHNYTMADGLQGDMFLYPAATRHPDGTLFFGGNNGLNAVHPDDITHNPHPPPVVLTDFQLFNESVPIGEDSLLHQSIWSLDHLTLSHHESRFTFEFAALSYTAPEENRYRYRLAGFEKHWNTTDSSRRFATYSSLPPGTYHLQVQGSNNDGVWNREGATLTITVLPPWWETWWFQSLVFLLIGGVVLSLYKWRVYATQQRNQQLTALVDERTRALRESERALTSLINNLPGVVYRCQYDTGWKTIFISDGCMELTGYEPATFLQNGAVGLQTLIHPDERQTVQDTIEQALAHQQPFALNYRMIDRRGYEKWVWSQGGGVFGNDGRLLFIEGLLMDISERKRNEDNIRTLYQAVKQSPASVIITDPAGTIEYVNPRFTQITGYAFEEAYRQNPRILKSGYVTLETYQELWGTITSGGEWRGELLNRRKDGVLYWEMAYISPILNDDGTITHFVGVKEDITERKEMETALQHAKDMAESATRSKSEFLATMSHEIRTPMNAVIGMTNLLLDTPLSDEQQDYTQTIRMSGEALLTLINDILDFSKIEAGRLELEQAPFTLRTCVEEALELLAPKAAEKGLELVYWMEPGTPEQVSGDISRVRQILVNLLSNAVKFTTQGEVVVTVGGPGSGGEHAPAARTLHIAVRDTGIGIPADRLHRLFQSFSQVDSSTTRKYGGTGLGLAISKRLAEMMGGDMWVESEEGVGSTFHITFAAEPIATELPPFLASHQPALQGKRVLLVDNHVPTREVLCRYIQGWGMHAHVVETVNDACAWIVQQSSACDVMLVHVRQPPKEIATLAAQLREHCPTSTIPILALVSLTMRRELSNVSNTPITAFVVKPVAPTPLHTALVGTIQGEPVERRHSFASQMFEAQDGQCHPLRILLAEDNIINQKVALRLLERMGYRADVAATGFEVLEALYRQHYDVVLMDVEMPDMDGVEATRRIREQWPASQQPYIIAMTAHAMESDRQWCLDVGMDEYLGKPVRVEALEDKLRLAAKAREAGGSE
jgi:PAS domain S-box-containing protein